MINNKLADYYGIVAVCEDFRKVVFKGGFEEAGWFVNAWFHFDNHSPTPPGPLQLKGVSGSWTIFWQLRPGIRHPVLPNWKNHMSLIKNLFLSGNKWRNIPKIHPAIPVMPVWTIWVMRWVILMRLENGRIKKRADP